MDFSVTIFMDRLGLEEAKAQAKLSKYWGMTREAPASRLLQLSRGWYMIVKIQECRTRQKRGAYGQTESHPDDRPV